MQADQAVISLRPGSGNRGGGNRVFGPRFDTSAISSDPVLRPNVASSLKAQESTAKLSSLASSLEKAKKVDLNDSSSGFGASVNQSHVLVTRPPRQFISLWSCSKLCAACFIAGIIVGYTLKKRVRRWASRLLRKLKDD